jgi:hypothetical protein
MSTIQACLDRLQQNSPHLDNRDDRFSEAVNRLGSSSGLYLSYDATEGWSVVPFNCIERFFRWAIGLVFGWHSSTHLATIATKLEDSPDVPLILRNKIIACWNKTYPGKACPLSASVHAEVVTPTNNQVESESSGLDPLPSPRESNVPQPDLAPASGSLPSLEEALSQWELGLQRFAEAHRELLHQQHLEDQRQHQLKLQQIQETERLRQLAPDPDKPLFVRTLRGKELDPGARVVDEDFLAGASDPSEGVAGYYQLRDLDKNPSYSYEYAFISNDEYALRWNQGNTKKMCGGEWEIMHDDKQARLILGWLPKTVEGGDVITTSLLPDSPAVFTYLVNNLIDRGCKVQEEVEFTLEKEFMGRRLRITRPAGVS